MALSSKSLAGPGYVILNGIRVVNIIGLLAVIAACVVMLIKTTTDSPYFFFDACTDVVVAFSAVFLILSELNLFKSFFARNMPLLSAEHGFITLSLAMFVLGTGLLGKLNHASNDQKALGLGFWRVVIGAGILIFILSFVNLVASLLFRDRRAGITARQVRAHGAVASHMTPPMSAKAMSSSTFHSPGSDTRTPITTNNNNNNNRRSTLRNPLRLITEPFNIIHDRLDGRPTHDPILPSYQASTITPPRSRGGGGGHNSRDNDDVDDDHDHDHDDHHHHHRARPAINDSPTSKYSRATLCFKKGGFHPFGAGSKKRESLAPPLPINISAPLNTNPQFEHLRRPDTAMHPAKGNVQEGWRGRF